MKSDFAGSLSWDGHCVLGDRESIIAVERALNEAGKVEQLSRLLVCAEEALKARRKGWFS